jgi:hypothetical protein
MMHVVLGDGEMSRRELSSTLEDLLEKAGDEDFWFLVQAKAEPTATDKAMMEWIAERGVYYETIGDDLKSADKIYKDAQEKHEVKRLAPKVVSLMEEKPAEGEGAALYALFVNNDEEVEEDKWLMDVATSVADKDYIVYAMNDGLAELGFDDEGGDEAEPEPEPEPPKKAPAKKAAAKKAAPKAAVEEDEETETGTDPDQDWTREQLEEKTLVELKEIALAKGLDIPPRTKGPTYITAILGEDDRTPDAVTEPVPVPEIDLDGADGTVFGEGDAVLVLVFPGGMVVTRPIPVPEAIGILE